MKQEQFKKNWGSNCVKTKLKKNEPRSKFTGSYKKSVYVQAMRQNVFLMQNAYYWITKKRCQ